ncbi:gamma-aminobutyric acid receptor subunit alpha-6-like [Galendromus occidentalis]|uniref:Gamma-aminobutyric acid receptor subunit alpha-6-like n=1 Tax=Galendromus occidentalis TaxID=34638 RepID=A0AAJ7WJN7_9ACAR|nr:gamma-aminobutyric acid receptor subunit alpha-6-like [Galendromus occidentalis]
MEVLLGGIGDQRTTEFTILKVRSKPSYPLLEDLNSTLSKEIMANTSLLLDSLLSEENYDRRIRPGFGGNATKIITDVEIRSFGPVSENDMMYSMDCYFRQSWRDERLKFEGSLKKLSVSWQFLERIWTPDTYINNGKSSYLHKVSVPNKFVRLHGDGTLKYSMRLTIRAKCPMHLRKYPLDTQACPLEIGSYAYSPKDVVFHWNGKAPVVISKDVTLSQYEFVDILSNNLTVELPNGETRSTLVTRFILRRRRGYFILQIYAPCSMIVGASWVAFWINRNDAAGRVAVGATTVLTLVTMGFGGRASLPKVNYATALDWFVVMCFSFVFAAMVEYACVNYIERYMAMRQRKQLEARTKYETRHEQVRLQLEKEFRENGRDPNSVRLDLIRLRLEKEAEREEEADCEDVGFLADFRAYCRRRRRHKYIRIATQPEREDALTPHEISGEVDAWARIIFPSTFFLFMLCYWILFLYLVDDEIDYSNPIGGMTLGVPLHVNNSNRSDSNL